MEATNYLKLETPAGRTLKVATHEHPLARRLSLTIGVTGPKISAPKGTHRSQMKAFLKENADWLDKQLRALERQGRKLAPPIVGVRDTIVWRGEQLPVRWDYGVFPSVRVEDGWVTVSLDLDHPEARLISQRAMRAFVQSQMKREVTRLRKHFAPLIGKDVRATRLLPLKSLWGSLSVEGRMTLDLALMLAPPSSLEYVIAHEMSHLWIRNHGKRFWQRVEHVFPELHETRAWLSKSGYGVKAELARWIGASLA